MTVSRRPKSRVAGFTIIELMIAMLIGFLITIGIVTLFDTSGRVNRLQSGLARLQENGRFAVTQLEYDLRMASAQFCSNYSGNSHVGAARPMWSGRPPVVYAPDLNLPDSGGMRSVNLATGARATSPATLRYALSPRFFVQGYACATGSTCTPGLPTAGTFPTAGLANNNRVPNTEILTVRYQRGTGWPVTGLSNCGSGDSITLAPQPGDDPVSFAVGNIAFVSDCQSPALVPISGVAGNVLTIGPLLPGAGTAPSCNAQGARDVRVFNFSQDFVTISYYLAFRLDDNPEAIPNSPAGRLIPTLIRRENGIENEIVRGVDNLTFRYGVLDRAGEMRFLTAAQVDNRLGGAINCPLKPELVAPDPANPLQMEPGCLWRSVRRIEAHLLVNSVDDIVGLDAASRTFTYMGVTTSPAALTTPLPSTIQSRSMPRREFIAQVAARNANP